MCNEGQVICNSGHQAWWNVITIERSALLEVSVMRRESVVLKDLKDCSVYLLDYSGEVEVTNVQDSQIFIGKPSTPCSLDARLHLSVVVG